MPRLTLGSDPELMIYDNNEGKIVSSIPIIKKNKNDPIIIPGGAKFYYDNVLAEFSHAPVESSKQAVDQFRDILGWIQYTIGERYSLAAHAAHFYDEAEVGRRVEENPAWAIGCNPNLDCYLERVNPTVDFKDTMRTGSFHVHIGHEKLKTMEDKGNFVKLLDVYLGCSSVIFDKDKTSNQRRKYYGRAGEFRSTEYGCEYRVCGPYALRSPETVGLVFDIAQWASSHIDSKTVKDVIGIKSIQLHAQSAINNNEPIQAEKVLNNAHFPSKLLARVKSSGMFLDLEKEWGIN